MGKYLTQLPASAHFPMKSSTKTEKRLSWTKNYKFLLQNLFQSFYKWNSYRRKAPFPSFSIKRVLLRNLLARAIFLKREEINRTNEWDEGAPEFLNPTYRSCYIAYLIFSFFCPNKYVFTIVAKIGGQDSPKFTRHTNRHSECESR